MGTECVYEIMKGPLKSENRNWIPRGSEIVLGTIFSRELQIGLQNNCVIIGEISE